MNETKKPLIVAHRGASDIAPENTLKAFQKAIELGADFIEFDLRSSYDGELVIFHDNCIFRMAKKLNWINKMTLKEIKLLDIGKGENIPTLQELIKHTKGKIKYMCEIKVRGIINHAVNILDAAGILESTIFISFKHDELLKIKKIYPNLKIGAILPTGFSWFTNWLNKKQSVLNAKQNGFYAINPYHRFLNRKYIKLAHNKNLKIFPWTINSIKKLNEVFNMGVDGVLTNHIKKAIKIRESK